MPNVSFSEIVEEIKSIESSYMEPTPEYLPDDLSEPLKPIESSYMEPTPEVQEHLSPDLFKLLKRMKQKPSAQEACK